MKEIDFTGFIIASAIIIAVFLFLLRWALSIDKTIKQRNLEIELLARIAEKSGVNGDEIKNLFNKYG